MSHDRQTRSGSHAQDQRHIYENVQTFKVYSQLSVEASYMWFVPLNQWVVLWKSLLDNRWHFIMQKCPWTVGYILFKLNRPSVASFVPGFSYSNNKKRNPFLQSVCCLNKSTSLDIAVYTGTDKRLQNGIVRRGEPFISGCGLTYFIYRFTIHVYVYCNITNVIWSDGQQPVYIILIRLI